MKTTISELKNFDGKKVTLNGWVYNIRSIGKIWFLILRDGSGLVQCVVIDKETGSYLSGRGAGNILMEIDTNGKFNMWGDFITFDGIYNFKNLSVIDKKFNLESISKKLKNFKDSQNSKTNEIFISFVDK